MPNPTEERSRADVIAVEHSQSESTALSGNRLPERGQSLLIRAFS
jgi:hypothetical protein